MVQIKKDPKRYEIIHVLKKAKRIIILLIRLPILLILQIIYLQKKKSSFLKAGGKIMASLWGDKTAVFG